MKIEEAPRILNAAINKAVNKNTEYTLKIIQRRILNVQNRFFTYLVNSSGIIGASSTPSFNQGEALGTYRPLRVIEWSSFSKSYLAEKRLKHRTKAKKSLSSYKDKFFINSGQLKNTLRGLSSNDIFGTPEISFTETDKKQQLLQNFSGNKRIGVINIDLFPKLNESLKAEFSSSFYTKFFNQKQKNETGKKPVFVGMKLRAVLKGEDQGNPHRPFIGQYMQWWVKVKAKQSVLKGIS